MVARRLNLSRDQLATFLKDHEQIKQFEQLFSTVDDMVTSGDDAASAIATGNEVAAALVALSETLERAPVAYPPFIPDEFDPPAYDPAPLDARVSALEQAPPFTPPPLAWGIYTPTLTNVANVAASTAYVCQWMRVGDMVTVTGKVDVDPTAAVSTQLGISLPVSTNLANAEECAGTAYCPAIAGQGAAILGDVANDRAQMQWIAVDVTNQPMYFTFGYRVI